MSLFSAVMILPGALRAAGDALSVAMSHADPGVSTYEIPLRPIGGGEPTHYACLPWVAPDFRSEIESAQQGAWPESFTPEMFVAAGPVMAGLIASFVPDEPGVAASHFASVLAGLELEAIPRVLAS